MQTKEKEKWHCLVANSCFQLALIGDLVTSKFEFDTRSADDLLQIVIFNRTMTTMIKIRYFECSRVITSSKFRRGSEVELRIWHMNILHDGITHFLCVYVDVILPFQKENGRTYWKTGDRTSNRSSNTSIIILLLL